MDEFEFQKDWDNEAEEWDREERRLSWEAQERELEVQSEDPDQEPTPVAWEGDDEWTLREEAANPL